jgi:putative CocE/NonD family hydrolase
MRGVSWGGFSTLQAAARAPPALKAIMPMCASDRRYTDDAHYVGGAFALTGLKWATSFKAVMAGPPDPEIFGPDWEAEWMARLEAAPPIAAQWLRHQREDAYWRQGSVGFDPAAIRCPAYFVGGWIDPYNEMIPRLLERVTVPTKALIGPWTHGYPSPAAPGPGLIWEVEEVAWWRHWLAGEDTGVMDGPRVWAFLPEQAPARADPGPLPGRWIAEPTWPPRTETLKLGFEKLRLREGPSRPEVVRHGGERIVGLQTPEWVPFSAAQYPQEQSLDDMFSLQFSLHRFPNEPLDLFGVPRVRLCVAASAPVAKLSVRLVEVEPDGRSWLISYGVLNLTHRRGHADPEPLIPDEFYDVEVPLYLTGRRLAGGSSLCLCVSEQQWPLIWPSPAIAGLKLDLAGCSLELPVRPVSIADPPFPIPIAAAATGGSRGEPEVRRQQPRPGVEAQFDERFPPTSVTISDTGTTIERSGPNVEARLAPGDPNSGRWRVWQSVRYLRGAWDCTLEAEAELTSDAASFHVREKLTAKRGEAVVFEREHASAIPRDLM